VDSRLNHDSWGLKNNINTCINVKLIFLVGAWAPNGLYLRPPLGVMVVVFGSHLCHIGIDLVLVCTIVTTWKLSDFLNLNWLGQITSRTRTDSDNLEALATWMFKIDKNIKNIQKYNSLLYIYFKNIIQNLFHPYNS
jgi:hypothetical protein